MDVTQLPNAAVTAVIRAYPQQLAAPASQAHDKPRDTDWAGAF